MNKWKDGFQLALKGAAMGMAEVIPGVSGGTIAFITGIYERLIHAIKTVLGPESIRALQRGGFSEFWRTIDGGFLFKLLAGMAVGLVIGVLAVTRLLETYPVLLWAFFFGLIIASAVYIGRQVERWTAGSLAALVIGTALAYWITVAAPASGNQALWFVFVSGMIAISALILPGISGSFILLLLGMYTYIIPTVKEVLQTFSTQSLTVLVVFALGCLLGLAIFSRFLSWTFKSFPNITLALLTGFLIGSLNKIWPWRNVLSYRTDSSGEEVPFLERSVLPGNYEGEPYLIGAVICVVTGVGLVFILGKLGSASGEPAPAK